MSVAALASYLITFNTQWLWWLSAIVIFVGTCAILVVRIGFQTRDRPEMMNIVDIHSSISLNNDVTNESITVTKHVLSDIDDIIHVSEPGRDNPNYDWIEWERVYGDTHT